MTHRMMLIPVGFGVGLTSVVLGLLHACQQQGIKVGHFKPISQPSLNVLTNKHSHNDPSKTEYSIPLHHVEQQMANGQHDLILEKIVENFNLFSQQYDVVIIEGLIPTTRQPYAGRINRDVAQTLSADIVLVASPDSDSTDEFEDRIEITAETFGGIKNKRLIGCIINKINSPDKDEFGLLPRESDFNQSLDSNPFVNLSIFKNRHFYCLAQFLGKWT